MKKMDGMRIEIAVSDDLGKILALQKIAYRSEAELVGDFTIQPLMQTIEEIREEFKTSLFLKCVDEDREIVG